MERELDTLKRRKAELEEQLGDPEAFRDPRKIKELSIELGRVEKELGGLERTGGSGEPKEKVIVEIRAGTGGNEAAIFAGELLRMYANYAKRRGWTVSPIDSHPAALGGYKE